MAAGQAPCGQSCPFQNPVFIQRLERVLGTGRVKTAGAGPEGRPASPVCRAQRVKRQCFKIFKNGCVHRHYLRRALRQTLSSAPRACARLFMAQPALGYIMKRALSFNSSFDSLKASLRSLFNLFLCTAPPVFFETMRPIFFSAPPPECHITRSLVTVLWSAAKTASKSFLRRRRDALGKASFVTVLTVERKNDGGSADPRHFLFHSRDQLPAAFAAPAGQRFAPARGFHLGAEADVLSALFYIWSVCW